MKKVNNLLVVDDDRVSRFLAGIAIEKASVANNVIYCNNGEEAIHFIKYNCVPTQDEPNRYCPELILLDLNMPSMSAHEFLEQLASIEDLLHNNTSIILLSSSSYPNEGSKIKKFTILGFLEKPITSEGLLELLRDTYKPLQ